MKILFEERKVKWTIAVSILILFVFGWVVFNNVNKPEKIIFQGVKLGYNSSNANGENPIIFSDSNLEKAILEALYTQGTKLPGYTATMNVSGYTKSRSEKVIYPNELKKIKKLKR